MSTKQFSEIVSLIKQTQNRAFRIVNAQLVNIYWQVGEYISKQVAAAIWVIKPLMN
ncbi:MAG: hypothetical protein KA792_00985 [Bacteroidales bacterium]|nr:hypothetical protein [Bacteroidales bacterium]